MKKYKILITGFLAVSVLFSCQNDLDLKPDDLSTSEVVFSNKGQALGALTGVYSLAQDIDAFGGSPQLMGEWQSDNVEFSGSFPTFQDVYQYSTNAGNTSIQNLWRFHYKLIGGANFIIKYVPNVPETSADDPFTSEERADAIGQAKFMRALAHFSLSTFFSHPYNLQNGANLAVPIVAEPFDGPVKSYPRATLAEVYNFIEQDLLDAVATITNTDTDRATVKAAKALLARLYLYKGDNAKAADYANQVINIPGVALAPDYSFYDTTGPELIFIIANIAADPQNGNEGFSGLLNGVQFGGRGDAPFSQNLIDDFNSEPGDLRFAASRMGNTFNGDSRLFTTKFPDGTNKADDVPVLRATEMYLIRAEANFKNGSSIGDTPLNDLNALRQRANLGPLASVSLAAILKERRKELCFEGHRRMDLLRNGENLRRPGMTEIPESALGQDKTIFPIPAREVDLSGGNLIQNKGY